MKQFTIIALLLFSLSACNPAVAPEPTPMPPTFTPILPTSTPHPTATLAPTATATPEPYLLQEGSLLHWVAGEYVLVGEGVAGFEYRNGITLAVDEHKRELFKLDVVSGEWIEIDWLENVNIMELPTSLEDVVVTINYDREDQEGFSTDLRQLATRMIEQAVVEGIDPESVGTVHAPYNQLDPTAAGVHYNGPWLYGTVYVLGHDGDTYYQLAEVFENGEQVGYMLSVLVRDRRGENMNEITDRTGFNIIHLLVDNEAYNLNLSIDDRFSKESDQFWISHLLNGDALIEDCRIVVAGSATTNQRLLSAEETAIAERFPERYSGLARNNILPADSIMSYSNEKFPINENRMYENVAVVFYSETKR